MKNLVNMNSFEFIGRVVLPENPQDIIGETKDGRKYLKLLIKIDDGHTACAYLYGDALVNGCIPVYCKGKKRMVPPADRFKLEVLNNISPFCKYTIKDVGVSKDFIWKDDFISYFYNIVTKKPKETIYKVEGEFRVSYSDGHKYNNFNIRKITVGESSPTQLNLYLNLFYNNESLQLDKLVLNAYVEQYSYATSRREYFPLQLNFTANEFNFNELIPRKEEGFVKCRFKTKYVKGAKLIPNPDKTDSYSEFVVGEASEFIYLNSNLNQKYILLEDADEEFNNKISVEYKNNIEQKQALSYDVAAEIEARFEELDKLQDLTLDNIAKQNAMENPFY